MTTRREQKCGGQNGKPGEAIQWIFHMFSMSLLTELFPFSFLLLQIFCS